jgi:hypothetical protein
MRLPLGLAAATGCLLLAGACGGDDGPNAKRFDGENKDVAAVIDDLQSASRENEPERICKEVFAPALAKAIARETSSSCPKRVGELLVSEDATFKAGGVRMDGTEKAVVNVTDKAGNKSILYMAKTDDGWRIASIAR